MRVSATLVLTLLIIPAIAFAGPFEDGKAAYARHDDLTALKLLIPLADQGNVEAQLLVGEMYDIGGSDLKPDKREAAKWMVAAAESYRKAADQGDAESQTQLGSMYHAGTGVAQNQTEALKWYRKAADQGYARAQYAVGMVYQRGSGVWPNSVEALKWYRKAADQGYAQAQYSVGSMYESGAGVERDSAEAYFWYSLASHSGVKHSITRRDEVAAELSPEQLSALKKRVSEWKPTLVPSAVP